MHFWRKPYKSGTSFENYRNCFSVTAFKECEGLRANMTDSNIIFLNRLVHKIVIITW